VHISIEKLVNLTIQDNRIFGLEIYTTLKKSLRFSPKMSEELDDFEKEIFERHAVRSDLCGIPTPNEQKWLDMIRRERQRDWFLEKVKIEDEVGCISVGGLAVDLGLYVGDKENE